MVFILVLLLAAVPAWSSTPGPINPAGSGKSLTTDLNTTADDIIKTEIILAWVPDLIVIVILKNEQESIKTGLMLAKTNRI